MIHDKLSMEFLSYLEAKLQNKDYMNDFMGK